MTTEAGEIKAYTLVNRVVDFTMKGSYGYQTKRFREGGGSMLTAESTVKEFVIEKMEEVELPHWGKLHCFIGTDYYGREMSLPVKRVLGFKEKDTPEQGRLKGLLHLKDMINNNNLKGADPTATALVMETMIPNFEWLKELQEKGIELYVPKRATEDEL